MNLTQMRIWASMIMPQRGDAIHKALPVEAVVVPQFTSVTTPVSPFCEIGPNANHSRCQETTCKCPCHDAHENFGESGYWGWGM